MILELGNFGTHNILSEETTGERKMSLLLLLSLRKLVLFQVKG
jgi:hypothetical protein